MGFPRGTEFHLPDGLRELYASTEGPFSSPDMFECWVLYKLAQDAKVGIVEVGTWRGRSACFLAWGADPGVFIHCVDWWKGDTTGGEGADRALCEASLTRNGVRDRVELFTADCREADWSTIARGADLVFYDAEHKSDTTFRVISDMTPYLSPKAVVVLHDTDFPEVSAAITRIVDTGVYREIVRIPVWHGLTILQGK